MILSLKVNLNMNYLTYTDSLEKVRKNLSVRCYNGLCRGGIHTIEDLINYDREKLSKIKNLGKQSVDEIISFIYTLKSGKENFRLISHEELPVNDDELADCSTDEPDENMFIPQFRDTDGILLDDISLKELWLSTRSFNALTRAGYSFASELINITEARLSEIKNLGKDSIKEILAKIESLNFTKIQTDNSSLKKNIKCKDFVTGISELVTINSDMLYHELLPIFERAEEEIITDESKKMFSSIYLRNAVKDKIFSFLADFKFGVDMVDIIALFPENIVEIDIIEEIIVEMESEEKILIGNRIEIRRPTIFEYVQKLSIERDWEILLKRLQGLTLEEISSLYNLTRERVRQIISRILRRLHKSEIFAEDKYVDIFLKYDFTKEEFFDIFGDNEIVYNYLNLVCDKESVGKSLEEFIEDKLIPIKLRENAEKALIKRVSKKYLTIGSEKIYKSRSDLADYVMRTYFQDEASFDEFFEIYNIVLDDFGVAEDSQFIINSRSYENRFGESNKILWKQGRKFRYYNIESRDFTELFQGLALDQYNNVEYSSLKFFRDYSNLMKQYDIRDEYELHNLLKKLCQKLEFSNITFRRMPMIEFGRANRDAQVLNMLMQLAPVTLLDFAAAYEAEYGVLSTTVMGGFLKNFNEYLHNGVYYISEPVTKLSSEIAINNFEFETTFVEKSIKILTDRYNNGFRVDSFIEISRFRRFITDDLGDEFYLSDDELKHLIISCGMFFEGKVYIVSPQTKKHINGLVEDYFNSGAKIIFYGEFYAKNEHWLFENSIISEEMLEKVFRQLFPSYIFTQTYFGFMNVSVYRAIESEILRVWGDDILLSYEQISERLTYIPIKRIKDIIGRNNDFVWNSIGIFSHISRIEITKEEKETICEIAASECSSHGYVSISDMSLEEIKGRNYKLSITAIHNAVYRICLSEMFDKNGKIITRKGDILDALTIMKEYCRTIDKCSLNELLEFEKELTGEIHSWLPMQAGYEIMVRTDENTFVSEKYLDFDVSAIDNAIEYFVNGEYIPLRLITTFAVFPYCGQTWNLFLLESYVRRFSYNFRFETPSVNNKNVGCIVCKHSKLNYDEIMADAISRSNIQLDENEVADFLFKNGYRGNKQKAKITYLIHQATDLRESGD